MAVQYNRLFKMMIDRKMTPAELRYQAGIKICRVMQCGVDEILEFMPDKEERKQ